MSLVDLLIVAATLAGAAGATPNEAFAGLQASVGLQATRGLNTSVSTEAGAGLGLMHGASDAGTRRGAQHIAVPPLTPPGTPPVSHHVSPTADDTTSTTIADDKTTPHKTRPPAAPCADTTHQQDAAETPKPPPSAPVISTKHIVDTDAAVPTAKNVGQGGFTLLPLARLAVSFLTFAVMCARDSPEEETGGGGGGGWARRE